MSRLAWVTADRQIAVAEADGSGGRRLTAAVARGVGAWSQLAKPQVLWSWPTWSPDRQWVAAFAVEASDDRSGPARVVALSADGLRETHWGEFPQDLPIYLQWHPHNRGLGVLTQRNQELVLSAIAEGRLGRARAVEAGVPLFFNWSPDGERILVHAGDRGAAGGRMVLRDPFGGAEDVLFTAQPGSFCAPIFVGPEAVWARRAEAASEVVASTREGGEPRRLLARDGLLALVPAPVGRPLLAVAHAAAGEGSPYTELVVVDVITGEVRLLAAPPCLAFFWSPDARWLLVAQVASADNCLRWWKVPADGSAPIPLATFWPTREMVFLLHFFDQFTGSHPLVSSEGRHLAFAGYPAGDGQADLSAPPCIFLKDVDRPDAPAEEVDGGSFAVFSS